MKTKYRAHRKDGKHCNCNKCIKEREYKVKFWKHK